MRSLSLIVLSLAVFACGKSETPKPAAPETRAAPPAKPTDHGHGHSHGEEGHAHKAPHGGQIVEVGKYHLEAVASKVGLMVYLLDEQEAELPVSEVTGKVLLSLKDGTPPVEAEFLPMGNHMHAEVTFTGAWTAVVTLQRNGETLTGRFTGEGNRAGDAHAGHDHGAMAMPGMKLSDRVGAMITPAAPLEAGTPATLTFAFKRNDSGGALADFEIVHEQKLHLFIVGEDMSFFAHEHPVAADVAAGTWTHLQKFPAPGKYHLYADFKSTSMGANVTRTDLVVPGTPLAPVPLTIDTQMTKTFGDLTVTLSMTPSPLARGDAMLSYTFADAAGKPVTDLSPYLGAFGHLFILKDDKVTMAHAHPQGADPTPEQRGGPEVRFHTQLPAAGKYKLWAQVRRGDTIVTTDWTVEVR